MKNIYYSHPRGDGGRSRVDFAFKLTTHDQERGACADAIFLLYGTTQRTIASFKRHTFDDMHILY